MSELDEAAAAEVDAGIEAMLTDAELELGRALDEDEANDLIEDYLSDLDDEE